MPFATATVLAGIGIATSVAGLATNYVANKDKAKAETQAYLGQTRVAAAQRVAAGEQQSVVDIQAAQEQAKLGTQRQVIGAQQQLEDIRRTALNLDATRRIREIIRGAGVAHGTALAVATAQGAAQGSGLQGGFADISNRGEINASGVRQQRDLGNQTFDINRQISQYYLDAQDTNSAFVEEGRQAQNNVLEAQKSVYDAQAGIASSYAKAASAGGVAAVGTGLMGLGGTLSNNVKQLSNLGEYFSSGGMSFGLPGGKGWGYNA